MDVAAVKRFPFWTTACVKIAAALLAPACAMAHDPNAPFAEWMMSLHQPDEPEISCCGPSDQFYATAYEADGMGGFIVHTAEFAEEIFVPPSKVNWQDINPTGRGVIFVSVFAGADGVKHPSHVYCFVPGLGM